MSEVTDILIVGAGTGGCSAAISAAQRELNVILVDRKPESLIGRKICGDAVSKAAFSYINEYIPFPEPSGRELLQEVDGIELITSSGHSLSIEGGDKGEGFVLDRYAFGQRLLKAALDSGIAFLPNCHVDRPLISQNTVHGVTCKQNGQQKRLEAKLTIDATGSSGILRKRLPAVVRKLGFMECDYAKKDIGFAYREIRDLKHPIPNPRILKLFFSQKLFFGGYFWLFARGNKSANIGLGIMPVGDFIPPRKIFLDYISTQPLYEDSTVLDGASRPLPLRRLNDSLVTNGLILVGDSGAMVNPMNGAGIQSSMLAGAMVGEVLEECVKNGNVSIQDLWPYNQAVHKKVNSIHAPMELIKNTFLSLSDFQLSLLIKNQIISQEDIRAGQRGTSIDFGFKAMLKRLYRGKRIPFTLLKLRKAVRQMSWLKEHYNAYPDSPAKFEKWRVALNHIFPRMNT
ncbi:MAG: geranylgeranyl reductase family protein [Promethearchaeota archaeon]